MKENIMTKESNHYIDKAEFAEAVVDYVERHNAALEEGKSGDDLPVVSEYIGWCFLKIAQGTARRDNFRGYTFVEEMESDAVDNCLKAIKNYRVDAETQSGKPNPFGYFGRITWFAFLRRIAKEKKRENLRNAYISMSSADNFVTSGDAYQTESLIGQLKNKIDRVRIRDVEIKQLGTKLKVEERRRKVKHPKSINDSDLTDFMA